MKQRVGTALEASIQFASPWLFYVDFDSLAESRHKSLEDALFECASGH
jgi:hypothetical protein